MLRRSLAVALALVVAAGAGLAARELRSARGDQAGDTQIAQSAVASQTGAAATASPKWYTRRLALPADVEPWSVRISPDGSALAAIQPPSRVQRSAVDDPPGEITATLRPVASERAGAGFAWLPDGGLVIARPDPGGGKLGQKTVSITVLEADGRMTALGSVEGGGLPPLALSPDGRWIAVAETQPPQLRLIDRRSADSRPIPLSEFGLPVALAWTSDGHVLFGKDSVLLRIATGGAIERLDGPRGVRLAGAASVSPDGSAVVFRAIAAHREGHSVFVDARWVDAPGDIVPTMWVTARELLRRSTAGRLQAYDPRTGATRDLGITLRGADARILAYSQPYLLWVEESGRVHLVDTRSAYDVLVSTPASGAQPYSGGGFLLLHQDGAELLTGADWFARVPPTAAPFAPGTSAKPGVRDPFADIVALPRLDQMTTGGALEVVARSDTGKRVRSPDGGWSLEVPADWRADVGRLRGGELYSFDPTGMDMSGNAPPPGGVRMSLMLRPDYERHGPAWYADREGQPYPGTTRSRTSVALAGTTAERLVMRENQPTPFDVVRVRWFLRHPSFDDRIVEIALFRADDVTLPAAERVLGSLQLFAPVSGPRSPILTHAEAIAVAVGPPGAKPTAAPAVPERIEAKLVTWKEYELAQASGRGYTHDADTPIWVVVRFGDYEPVARGIRASGPPPRWTWRFTILDARTGQGFGGGGGPGPTEPAWWPSLRDRAT